MTVDRRALITLERIFAVAEPWEGCALLLGTGGVSTHLRQIWPCLNAWPVPSERHRRFSLDPREQLLAQRWARQREMVVIGSAHSHPCSEPVPSAVDLALTVTPALVLIAGRGGAAGPSQAWSWGAWWLDGPRPDGSLAEALAHAVPLPWTMEA